MNRPYLQSSNIFFVPLLRNHLNFAVLVQRAIHELMLDKRDLIAVGLPLSVQASILEAITKLPRVSLIISSLNESDQREVFPVTPCDGIIEGVRTALERDIPLQFVDQEIAPGHLIDHFCIADEGWPDDGLALQHGAEWYLDLISRRLAHPPSRFEPVDTWRELHMATQLQRLYPRYRRILFICNATHVRPIQQLLYEPVLLIDRSPSSLLAPEYKIWEPSLPILMRYLDYIPRLVELYEEQRKEGTAYAFDKHIALLKLIDRLNQEARDLDFSIRHYQAFTQMLTSLLELERRISPQFETVMAACGSCFNNLFQERVYRHLLGYYDQVKVERIGRLVAAKDPVFEISLTNIQDSQKVFVARNCTQIEQYYEIVYDPKDQSDQLPDLPPDQPPGQMTKIIIDNPKLLSRLRRRVSELLDWDNSSSWPPMDSFVNDMRKKAYNLAEIIGRKQQVKSHEFQGSLYDGLDFRRTLRSYYDRKPKLFVKQKTAPGKVPVDHNEPIVWLFDGYARYDLKDPDLGFTSSFSGLKDGPQYITDWFFAGPREAVFNSKNMYGESVQVTAEKVFGRASFKDWSLTFDQIKERLGSDIDKRLPSVDALEPASWGGEISIGLDKLDPTRRSWWETLLIGALHYAKETVILVAPQEFIIPIDVTRQAAMQSKRITHIPLSRFTRDERRNLSIQYYIVHSYTSRHKDVNDPEYQDYLLKHFGDIMKQFWE
jgi:hypothetical protein